MAAKGQPAADVIELRDDGTVRLAWDTFDVTLRRPKIGEWRSFMEESEAADAWTREPIPVDPEDPDKGTRGANLLDLTDGPYLKLYQRILAELAGTEVPDDEAPTWMVDGDLMRRLSAHWRSNPLTRGEATLLATMTPSQ